MQFVAPAQIFLVLWLLAATAPAATALVNGSLTGLIDTRAKDLQLLPATDDRADEATQGGDSLAFIDATRGADIAPLLFLALSEGVWQRPFIAVHETSFCASGEQPIALSTSLLHTTVQRHRPRIAY
jgi:hypothetical protein